MKEIVMKQLILDVLEDVSRGQPNLESEAARKMVANLIVGAIKSEPWYLNLNTLDGNENRTAEECAEYYVSDKEKEKAKWVCELCGKSTYEVEYDYLGSGTNHLGCELKSQEDIDEQVYAQSRKSSKDVRGEKNGTR